MRAKFTRMVIIAVILASVPAVGLAQTPSDEHLKQMQEIGGRMAHPVTSQTFYQERTFLVLVGLVLATAGFVAFRVLRRRWGLRRGPVDFMNEAVLVVDVVNSTHLATHYGNGFSMRAMTDLEERTLATTEGRGVAFVKNTGDGYLMTFSSVDGAVQAAIALLKDLKDWPPDPSSGPPLKLRAGISYGEILLNGGSSRHGAAINKAFRLEGLSRGSFAHVASGIKMEEIPESNRIFIDEEAAQELLDYDTPHRLLGFCSLKGFSGLHRVYEILWDNETNPSGSETCDGSGHS